MDTNFEEDELLRSEPSNAHLMIKLEEVLNHTKSTSNTIDNYIRTNDAKVNKIESKQVLHTNRLDALELRVNQIYERTDSIANSNELLKQNFLKQNLTIVGIPREFGNDLNQIIFNIAALLKVKLNRNDIVNAYRINNSKSGLIVVRFERMEIRNELLHIKQQTKITLGDLFEVNDDIIGDQLIYLNPHVTPHFSKMMAKARIAVKEKNIHSYFISTQGLMIKSSPDGPAMAGFG